MGNKLFKIIRKHGLLPFCATPPPTPCRAIGASSIMCTSVFVQLKNKPGKSESLHWEWLLPAANGDVATLSTDGGVTEPQSPGLGSSHHGEHWGGVSSPMHGSLRSKHNEKKQLRWKKAGCRTTHVI